MGKNTQNSYIEKNLQNIHIVTIIRTFVTLMHNERIFALLFLKRISKVPNDSFLEHYY